MKKYSFIYLACIFALKCFGQNNAIDSLKKELRKHPEKDSIRAKILINLANFSDNNPQAGLYYADAAIKICQKNRDIKKFATAIAHKALNFYYLGEDAKAIYCYNKSITAAKYIDDPVREAKSTYNLSILYTNMGKYEDALELKLKALRIFRSLNDENSANAVISNIGVNYFYQNNYTEALNYYLKSLDFLKKNGNSAQLASAYLNIGLVYKKMGNRKRTHVLYQKALKLYEKAGIEYYMATMLSNIATLYDEENKPAIALAYYFKALKISRKLKAKREEASHLTDIGVVYSGIKEYAKSNEYLTESLAMLQKTQDLNLAAVANFQLAENYFSASKEELNVKITETQKLSIAEKFAQQALQISTSAELNDRILGSLNVLSKIHEKQKKYDLALSEYKSYALLKDSIYSSDIKTEIATKQLKHEAEKNQILSKAETESERKLKNYTMAGSGLLLFAGVFLFIGYKKRQDILFKQRDLLYKAHVSQTEMKVLRLQMNPHFIFNSLNSISDYIAKNNIEKADYYLTKFAKLMRGILENSEEKEIPIADELKMLELYMQLEMSRLKNKFSYKIEIDENINTQITMIPPLILQPFVENSIWHGLADKENEGEILIEVTKNSTMLNCIVEDNGIGRAKAKNTRGKSLGMKITKDRIKMLNKFKNTNASIHIVDLDYGTRVEVKLPIETSEC